MLGTAENHVAVQVVPLVARRRVLVADEGGEVARVVVRFSGLDDLRPGTPHDVHVQMFLGARVAAQVGAHTDEDAAALVGLLGHAQVCGDRVAKGRGILLGHRWQHAQVHAVVGDGLKIERSVELHVEAGRMLDRPALGELVGVVGAGCGSEDEGVEGVAGVDMEVAEISVPGRVRPFGRTGRRRIVAAGVFARAAGAKQEGGKRGHRRGDRQLLHRDLLGTGVGRVYYSAVSFYS